MAEPRRDENDEPEESLADLLAEVRRIDVLSRRLVTSMMAGGYSSVFRGAGIEFDEVREYADGDDPRSVDWNVTARSGRTDRPFVKKFTDEREQTVLFLLDLSASMDGGFSAWSARGTAARVVGCLAFSAIRNDDKTGLIAFGREIERHVRADKGAGHVLRIIRDALALRATKPGSGLASALEFTSRAERRRAVVFVVSDFLADGWEDALGVLARRHDVVAVRIAVPEMGVSATDAPGVRAPGLAASAAGLVRVRDPETGREAVVDWRDAATQTAFARRTSAWRAHCDDAFRRARVDVMDVAVPRDADPNAIAGPILRLFRMRAQRGAKR